MGTLAGPKAGAPASVFYLLIAALALGAGAASRAGARQCDERVGRTTGSSEIETIPTPEGSGGEIASSAGIGLFDTDSMLAIRLVAPWGFLLRSRETLPTVVGTLEYTDASGTGVLLDVQIKPRGEWRLKYCSSPPLTLELSHEQIESTAFADQPVIHVSTQCHPNARYQQHLLQEYLIYRMYRVLTETSLRVRPAVVEYLDTEGRRQPREEHAFLVEDIGLVAERLGRRWVEAESVTKSALEPAAVTLLALFQFMVGHTDWSMVSGTQGGCCHNTALLAPPETDTGLLPVPFDFDATGLVNSGDHAPSQNLKISSVRIRLYRGFCIHNPQLEASIGAMNRARPELEAIFETTDLLTSKYQRSALNYLDGFYEIINDPAKVEKRILAQCR